MALSNDLISQFVKITKTTRKSTPTTLYGTVKIVDRKTCVQLDGSTSEQYTPVVSPIMVNDGDRVSVTIDNHTATITGNMTTPSATDRVVTETKDYLKAEDTKIKNLVADSATIENLTANKATIASLIADSTTIENLTANNATIASLIADSTTINNLIAEKATISSAIINSLSTKYAAIDFANIDAANIDVAKIGDLYTRSGIIDNLSIEEGRITGELHGVTIHGDYIDANTIVADKLVVLGEDGLYYKLNVDAEGTAATEQYTTEQLQNGLLGSVIIADSITADKIHVTDLTAFGATIGGFTIGANSLYSQPKSSIDNTIAGIYLDSEGQMAVGDANNYLKFYKETSDDADECYKLALRASSIVMGTGQYAETTNIDDIEYNNSYWSVEAKNGYILLKPIVNEGNYVVRIPLVTDLDAAEDGSISYTITAKIKTSLSHDSDIKFGVWDDNKTSNGGLYGSEGGSTTAGEWTILTWTITPTDETAAYGSLLISENYNFQVADEEICLAWATITSSSGEVFDQVPHVSNAVSSKDLATVQSSLDDTRATTNATETRVAAAETAIAALEDTIATLVRDSDGETLMTQNGNKWTFDMSQTQNELTAVHNGVNVLTGKVSDVEAEVSGLGDTLNELTERIEIATYDDRPGIKLSEGDSDYASVLTNTKLEFLDGSTVGASLSSENGESVLKVDEIRQQGYKWTVRPNGNYALMWEEDE